MNVLVYPDPQALAEVTLARLCLALADAAHVRGQVHLAVAGGSVASRILAELPSAPLARHVSWPQVHVWWVDERFVPAGHADRNDAVLTDALAALPLAPGHVHPMPTPGEAETVEEGAARYAEELARYAPTGARLPVFDVVLLGMGPDGHVASLFPAHPGLEVDAGDLRQVAFAVSDSPKPPAHRISLSLPAVNHARRVWVAAWGQDKAAAVAAAVAGGDVPAAGVAGRHETLMLTDVPGAAQVATRPDAPAGR